MFSSLRLFFQGSLELIGSFILALIFMPSHSSYNDIYLRFLLVIYVNNAYLFANGSIYITQIANVITGMSIFVG